MTKTLLSLLLIAGLAGCAAAPDLPSTYTLDANQPEGLAIVSLTLSGKPLDKVSGYEYRIRANLARMAKPSTSRLVNLFTVSASSPVRQPISAA
ncbi:MAG: hypothetical protein HZB40_13850 [Rhodocyclales bacterium]|nr:hypothetical protein [Rhodocyclales bacterium]